jgi:Bacterial Ig-like domain (group 1)
VNTDASGNATVQVLSDNAGGVTVSATAPGGASAQAKANFIATVAANIEVQPDPFTLAPGEQSVISAIVRDANNNLVTNANVVFSLSDITGGVLSAPSAVTNLEGRAQTTYTAGTVSSAANGVQITATVAGSSPLVSKTVGLTVAKRQVFISIGTGNEITEPNTAQYQTDYVVQVTDSNGAGVKNVPLSMSVLSQYYFKGERVVVGGAWATCYTIPQDLANCIVGTPPASTVTLGCKDEDTNRNGILDPLENKDGINPATGTATLEAGNIAAVAPSSISTDANGFAIVSVFYPQEYAYYLQVTLQAQATVQGTAFSAQSTFLLPGSAPDFSNVKSAPPGIVSPFGTSAFCSDMN